MCRVLSSARYLFIIVGCSWTVFVVRFARGYDDYYTERYQRLQSQKRGPRDTFVEIHCGGRNYLDEIVNRITL